ncbi:MAG: hypothetical protein KBA82_04315 [Nitrosomonas sp.]|nr:hypothetical protein [Nitrosomonas sp.]MBP7112192.1 hypothetical protein [Nitrosomonas sp.]
MLIQLDKLKSSIAKAREITEQHNLYYLDTKSSERSLDDLVDLCQKYLNKNVKLFEHKLHYTGQPMRGFFLAFDDSYHIVLLGGQNYCWKRLVLCKELFHIFLDDEEYQNKDIGALIDETTIGLHSYENSKMPKPPMQVELLAEIAAMEYLFPYNERRSKLDSFAGMPPNYEAIAEQYKIPRFYVEQYLSNARMAVLKDI